MATGKGTTKSHAGGAAGNTVTVVVSRTVAEQMYLALAKALAGDNPKKKGKGGKGGKGHKGGKAELHAKRGGKSGGKSGGSSSSSSSKSGGSKGGGKR